MAAAGKLQYVYLAFLSKPKEDRQLFRLVGRLRATRIVELGIGSLPRTLNLIRVCQRYSPEQVVRYTGLDWFEERPAGLRPLSLLDTHRQLAAEGAKPRLMPGGPGQALPAVANNLLGTDLVLISSLADAQSLAGCRLFLPRILTPTSVVLAVQPQPDGRCAWRELDHADIAAGAKAVVTSGAKAA
ncbi:MAG: hypothetical protein AAF790_01610 [Planctomycetota bacterium]